MQNQRSRNNWWRFQFKTREAVIIGGDFNAKTKSKFNDFPTNIIDKYAKREINIRGEKMTEFCVMNNLKTI